MGTRVTFTVNDDNVGPLISYLKGYLMSTPSVVIESVENIPELIVQEFRVVVTRPEEQGRVGPRYIEGIVGVGLSKSEITVTEITP